MYKRQHFKPESVINWDVMMYNDTGQVHCVNVKGLTQVQSRVYSCLTQILPQQDFVRSVIYFRLSQLSISRLEKRYAASDERDQAC